MTNCQPISITLSPTQVDQVVRAAAAGGTRDFPTLIATTLIARAQLVGRRDDDDDGASRRARTDADGLPSEAPIGNAGADASHDHRQPQSDESPFPEYSGDTRLSRSLLRGLSILTCFRPGFEERGILELAGELGMSASTTHRYVMTLVELGLLERCPRSRKYRLPTV
jgi:hypothetical protein